LDIKAQGNDEDYGAELSACVVIAFSSLIRSTVAFWGNQVIPRPSEFTSYILVQPTAGPSNSQNNLQTHPVADAGDLEHGDDGPAPSQPCPTRGRGPSKTAKEP
jgi:hypothetical protein